MGGRKRADFHDTALEMRIILSEISLEEISKNWMWRNDNSVATKKTKAEFLRKNIEELVLIPVIYFSSRPIYIELKYLNDLGIWFSLAEDLDEDGYLQLFGYDIPDELIRSINLCEALSNLESTRRLKLLLDNDNYIEEFLKRIGISCTPKQASQISQYSLLLATSTLVEYDAKLAAIMPDGCIVVSSRPDDVDGLLSTIEWATKTKREHMEQIAPSSTDSELPESNFTGANLPLLFNLLNAISADPEIFRLLETGLINIEEYYKMYYQNPEIQEKIVDFIKTLKSIDPSLKITLPIDEVSLDENPSDKEEKYKETLARLYAIISKIAPEPILLLEKILGRRLFEEEMSYIDLYMSQRADEILRKIGE